MSILLTDEISFWENVIAHSDWVLLFCSDDESDDVDISHFPINALLPKYGFAMRFCQINLRMTPELGQKLDLTEAPTFLLLRHGHVIDEREGILTSSELEEFIENHW